MSSVLIAQQYRSGYHLSATSGLSFPCFRILLAAYQLILNITHPRVWARSKTVASRPPYSACDKFLRPLSNRSPSGITLLIHFRPVCVQAINIMLVGLIILGMALGAFTAIGVLIFGHGIIAALIFYITAGILPLLMVCITQAVHSGACQTKKESSGRGALSQPPQKRFVRASKGHTARFSPESPPIGFKRVDILTRRQNASFL